MIASIAIPRTFGAELLIGSPAGFATASTVSPWAGLPSGPSALNRYWMPERGARIARREEGACWAQVSDEQRREAGCPARQAVVIQRGRATRLLSGEEVPTEVIDAA